MQDENDYQDVLGQWSDLESGLSIILSKPASAQQFVRRVVQYDRWMQDLMQRDADVGLYLLFQLAGTSHVGYSASHALVCAVLCHLVAQQLDLPAKQRNSLVRAAFTMNVAMTALQDQLAQQTSRPDPAQQAAIRAHPLQGSMMLTNLGVSDDDWLAIVTGHHEESSNPSTASEGSIRRLTGILQLVDRYAAMISPRASRGGRSSMESARALLGSTGGSSDMAQALVRAVGLCPPGTYVRLDNDELALVVRRTASINQPLVGIIGKSNGEWHRPPRMHATSHCAPRIRSALPASAVRTPINHVELLRQGGEAARRLQAPP